MQNKTSIMEIVTSSKVTTQDALNKINSLSKEQILECDQNNMSVLHFLAANKDLIKEDLNYEAIVSAIVSKNPEILSLKHLITFENPTTKKAENVAGDTPLEAAIRQDNLQFFKILAPHYKACSTIFDFRPGEQRDMTEEEIQKSKTLFEEHANYLKPAYVKTVDNIREYISPLAFCLRHGQFEMFQYLYKNWFDHLQDLEGLEDLSKYSLTDPKATNFILRKNNDITRLHWALKNGNIDAAEVLFDLHDVIFEKIKEAKLARFLSSIGVSMKLTATSSTAIPSAAPAAQIDNTSAAQLLKPPNLGNHRS